MSNFNETELRFTLPPGDVLFAGANTSSVNDSQALACGTATSAQATLTLIDAATFGSDSVASYECALNSPEVQEVLRLQKKEVLTRAFEEVRRRRQAVAAARHKIETDTLRLATASEVPNRTTTEALHRAIPQLVAPTRMWVQPEELRLVEPQVAQTKTNDQPSKALTLEQRLRAEIQGMAAAQKKSIDSARARLKVSPSAPLTHAAAA